MAGVDRPGEILCAVDWKLKYNSWLTIFRRYLIVNASDMTFAANWTLNVSSPKPTNWTSKYPPPPPPLHTHTHTHMHTQPTIESNMPHRSPAQGCLFRTQTMHNFFSLFSFPSSLLSSVWLEFLFAWKKANRRKFARMFRTVWLMMGLFLILLCVLRQQTKSQFRLMW